MEIIMGIWGWLLLGLLIMIALPLLAMIVSKNPFLRWFGAVGFFMFVVVLWGITLGYHDAQYWGDQDRNAYMLTMSMIVVLIIMTALATLALAEIQMKHGWIIIWWIAGCCFMVFTVWTLSWIIWNDWGWKFIHGEETASVETWWGWDLHVSATVLGMITMIFVGILVLAYALANTKYRADIKRSFRRLRG